MNRYQPQLQIDVDHITTPELARWLTRQLQEIADALNTVAQGRFDPPSVAPVKPRIGQFAYADTLGWNPGPKGFYQYDGTNWYQCLTSLSWATPGAIGSTTPNTGAFTTLSATGAITGSSTVQGTRLISTVATGTAPLTVASTTQVANLNCDLLDGIDSPSFGQLAGNQTWTGQPQFNCNQAASHAIADATGGLGGIMLIAQGSGVTAGAAFMVFHRPSNFATYFGLDTDNTWKVGGWSAGAVSYRLFTDQNTPYSHSFVNANFTMTAVHRSLNISAAGGAITITLPDANCYGNARSFEIVLRRQDGTANVLTVQRAGTNQIQNLGGTLVNSVTIPASGTVRFVNDGGSNWVQTT